VIGFARFKFFYDCSSPVNFLKKTSADLKKKNYLNKRRNIMENFEITVMASGSGCKNKGTD